MKRKLFSLFLGTLLISCNNYENKNRYELSVNEDVEIYYSTGSCCFYCVSNEIKLKHVKVIEKKIVKAKSGCIGCDHTGAFVFKGISVGIDTVELKFLPATMDCDSNNAEPEKYIIEIK